MKTICRTFFAVVAVFLAALPLPLPADETADRKIAADMNRHGFELFHLLSERDSKENAFISPYSIDSAFGLVYCGAKDRTAEEIRTTLGLPADPAECGRFFHAVSQEYAANKAVEVLVSNSVWYEQRYADLILPPFLAMIEKYYGGTFFKENFKKPAPLVAKVNAYVEDHTKNMIKDLLKPADITDNTFMILLNTLFFEAKWKTPFKKDDTKPMVFRNFDGTEKRVRMMYRRGFDIAYCFNEEDNVHAVVLPYEDTRFELVALMPIRPGEDRGESAMKDIVAKIGTRLDTWLSNRSPYETRLWLPIVDLTCKYSLKDALEELGMPTPFSETQANFHGIADPSSDPGQRLKYIWIEKVIHKTALKMDEEKTQAAAATAIIMGGFGGLANAQPPPVNIFRADRPYLVLIRDNKTGLILFAGRINDPGVEATEEDGPVAPSFEGMPFGLPPNGPGSTTPGTNSRPGFRPAPQTNPRQTTTARPGSATTRTGEPAELKADGKVLVVIEGDIDGKDEFAFYDNRIFLMHLSFEAPTGLTVNGKPWKDIYMPFELDFTPDPATTEYTCEGRGTCGLTRTNDSVTITVYDQQDSVAHYKITLFQPQTSKELLDPTQEQKTETGGQNKLDPYAGVPLWDKERDGQPEIRLRELVDDAAKRAEADLRSLGAVRTTSFDAEHAYADLDFTVVDEYSKIVCFIYEVEKQTPRLFWRRIEIRVEPAGVRTLAGDKPKTDAPPATDVRKYRLTGQIRVIKYTPAKKETAAAADDSASAQEKTNQEPLSLGDPDFLSKLYDLSLALPEEALVTIIRFTSGNCDLTIQAQNRRNTPDRYLVFPYWRIARLSQRIISNDVCSFAVSLVRNDDPSEPHQESATSAVMVENIVALNIFDPARTPQAEKEAVRRIAEPRAPELQRQMVDAQIHRAELESLLQALQQTQGGITKEQTEVIRQRIEACDQQIERIQDQLKALRP